MKWLDDAERELKAFDKTAASNAPGVDGALNEIAFDFFEAYARKLIAAVRLASKSLENAHRNALASGGSLPSSTLMDMRQTVERLRAGNVEGK